MISGGISLLRPPPWQGKTGDIPRVGTTDTKMVLPYLENLEKTSCQVGVLPLFSKSNPMQMASNKGHGCAVKWLSSLFLLSALFLSVKILSSIPNPSLAGIPST